MKRYLLTIVALLAGLWILLGLPFGAHLIRWLGSL